MPRQVGEVVHHEEPLAIMAANPMICDYCRDMVPRGTRRICAGCRSVVWCKKCCDGAAPEKHVETRECAAFQAIEHEQRARGRPKRQIWLRFAVRCLIAADAKGGCECLTGLWAPDFSAGLDENIDAEVLGVARSILIAEGHVSQEDGARPGKATEPREAASQESQAKIHLQLLAAVGGNAIALHSESGEVVAWALYLAAAMLNHSCSPNSMWTFGDGGAVTVQTMRPIEKESEIEVCYVRDSDVAPYSDTVTQDCEERDAKRPRSDTSTSQTTRGPARAPIRSSLADFEFTCFCPRCRTGAAGTSLLQTANGHLL